MAKVTIKGIEAAYKQLARLKQQSKQAMRRGEKKIADEMAAEMKARVPRRSGLLSASIGVEQTEESTTLFAGALYAPYQEFGTGPLTEAPPGFEAYAKEFIVSGDGHTPPRPFFFPAIFKYQDRVVPAVEKELNKLTNG